MSNTNTGIFPFHTVIPGIKMSILQIFMCVRNIVDALDDRNDFSEADMGAGPHEDVNIANIYVCLEYC